MFCFCSYPTPALPVFLPAWRLMQAAAVRVLLLAGVLLAGEQLAGTPAAGAAERLSGPYLATIERVIDGDSLAVRVKIWLGLDVSTIVRLRGIDAPELAGRCPEERRRAVAARDALAGLVAGGSVSLAAVETDKYGGRVVADVADGSGRPLGAALVEAGLARPYDGGRRAGWCRP